LGRNVRISSDVRIYGQENIEIGNNVRIDDFTTLSAVNGKITLGNFIFIARNSHLSGRFGIIMHDFSSMAANTIIYSASDDYSGQYMTAQAIPQNYTSIKGGLVEIGKHVIIGCGSTIIGGCKIEEGCSIGSMSMVNKDLESWGIYVGIPVKKIKQRKKDLLILEKRLLEELNL
jgi:acetyltransferase-like isoleucine patch superfamily enzyme